VPGETMQTSKLFPIIVLTALLAFCLAGCGSSESSDNTEPAVSAKKGSPERFELRNIYGKKYRWSQFSGKPFMINFWATWCGPCRAEIPAMKKIYAEYQPKGLEIVAISLDTERTKAQVIPFIDSYKIPWIVLYGGQPTAEAFNIGTSVPVTLFFDADGNETGRRIGAMPESIFRLELEKLFPSQG
jgi:thiol-disulfide isomerase/thioredoxin